MLTKAVSSGLVILCCALSEPSIHINLLDPDNYRRKKMMVSVSWTLVMFALAPEIPLGLAGQEDT